MLLAESALRRCGNHPVVTELLAELAPLSAERRRRSATIDRSCALLDELARGLGVGVWGIKGLSSRVGYPEPALREMRDVDVSVHGRDEAFALARALRGHGFVTDTGELPWLKADRHGVPYGQYKLTGPDGFAAIDLHFGPGYSTGHCGLLPVPPPTAPGLTPLPQVDNLRPMLGNSGGDIHITVKDVNDLWVVAGAMSDDEAAAVVADARAAALDGHLAAIAGVALSVSRVDERRREVLSAFAGGRERRAERPVLATGLMRRTSRVRVLRTATRAYRQAGAHTDSVALRVWAVLSALAYYSVPLRPRLTPLPPVRSTPRPWRCVRLVPLSLARDLAERGEAGLRDWAGDALPEPAASRAPGGVRFRRVGTGQVVVDGDGDRDGHRDAVFIPTVWFLLSRPMIRRAGAQ
nr:hypothetical protein GCM10020241_63110 [Streptoalloteichus tenebrarius]